MRAAMNSPCEHSWILVVLLLCISSSCITFAEEPTCRWDDVECGAYRDPKLEVMTADLGDGDEEILVYVERDVSTFYNQTPGSIEPVETKFRGIFGKFINMSPTLKKVYWQPRNKEDPPTYIANMMPFGAFSTATFPGHVFVVKDPKGSDPDEVIETFHVVKGNSLYVYDPFKTKDVARANLSDKQMKLYELQYRNLEFNKAYERKTKRQWIALYGRKHAPRYPIWPADAFGQTHSITTEHTHVVRPLPEAYLNSEIPNSGASDEERRALSEFQRADDASIHDPLPFLNLTMTVLSVSPRVFEIKNFLSQEEVQHIMDLAMGVDLARSTTSASSSTKTTPNDSTRTSLNTWLGRYKSLVLDLIYRRAADVLRIDEEMFRYRDTDMPGLPRGVRWPVAERLQLVHYAPGQRYTPHHDFSVPNLEDGQPSRFATMLLYLNDVKAGGETSFPRWLNGETQEELKVKPEPGKAILFYNQLPDGNYDERSQHSALPVIKGEKWLTNLWVWDPFCPLP